jgi:hypothetical protein
MVEAILDGRQPEGMTLPGLMKGVVVEWEGQCGELAGRNESLPTRRQVKPSRR